MVRLLSIMFCVVVCLYSRQSMYRLDAAVDSDTPSLMDRPRDFYNSSLERPGQFQL